VSQYHCHVKLEVIILRSFIQNMEGKKIKESNGRAKFALKWLVNRVGVMQRTTSNEHLITLEEKQQ